MNEKLGMRPVKEEDWVPLPGFEGLEQVVLSGELDERNRRGRRIRLVRLKPGVKTDATLVHDYFEETYLVEGSLSLVEDSSATSSAPAFVFRAPGTPHGPFVSQTGCVMLEVHYYA